MVHTMAASPKGLARLVIVEQLLRLEPIQVRYYV